MVSTGEHVFNITMFLRFTVYYMKHLLVTRKQSIFSSLWDYRWEVSALSSCLVFGALLSFRETVQGTARFFFSVSIVTLTLSCPDDGKFPEAVRVLLTWLERGEVNRRNANNFYSMIQSSNSHIRRLMSEKSQHEKEMEEAKDKFKTALAGILAQCELLQSVSHKHTLAYFNIYTVYTVSKLLIVQCRKRIWWHESNPFWFSVSFRIAHPHWM